MASSTTRRCNGSVRRSSSPSTAFPIPSVMRWASPSDSTPDTRRAHSSSGSRFSASSPKLPSSSRSCAWSTTRSGSMAQPPKRSRSWLAACWPSGSRSPSGRVRWAADWRASRSFASSRWAAGIHERSWSPALAARLDESVLERIIAETGGDPLALLGAPARADARPARRWFRPACGTSSVDWDRTELHAPAGAPSTRRTAVAAPGGGGAGRRPCASLAGGGPGFGIPETAAQAVESDGLLMVDGGVVLRSSARALGGVRGRRAQRAARGSPRAGGRNRSADRPRSPRVAPCAGGVGT